MIIEKKRTFKKFCEILYFPEGIIQRKTLFFLSAELTFFCCSVACCQQREPVAKLRCILCLTEEESLKDHLLKSFDCDPCMLLTVLDYLLYYLRLKS